MPNSEYIDVRVSQQVLWVGAEAYPLQNIARAQTIKLTPNRKAAWRRYLKAIVFWVFLGAAAAVATKQAPRLSSAQGSHALHSAATGVLVLVVALAAISTIRLISTLSRGTYYGLVIETAGSPRRVLVSTDQFLVTKLVHQIMGAINNPRAEFQERVENIHYHFGDEITQYGDHSVGKVSR